WIPCLLSRGMAMAQRRCSTIGISYLGGLIIKLIYNVPHMSDKMIADVVTGKKWAPEFIKQLATKEGMKRSLKL
ncbi:hypothetical protein ACV1D8_21885, partial [Aeromonas caviae]